MKKSMTTLTWPFYLLHDLSEYKNVTLNIPIMCALDPIM